ncbi:unnamed protein product [Lathyrus sativus]|nr:unnamed protein product [Lathyrus sativus]
MSQSQDWMEIRREKNKNTERTCKRSIWTARVDKDNMEEGSKSDLFFFTEFSDDHEEKDMFHIFKEFGLVLEVIISTRRDMRGKQFGFV